MWTHGHTWGITEVRRTGRCVWTQVWMSNPLTPKGYRVLWRSGTSKPQRVGQGQRKKGSEWGQKMQRPNLQPTKTIVVFYPCLLELTIRVHHPYWVLHWLSKLVKISMACMITEKGSGPVCFKITSLFLCSRPRHSSSSQHTVFSFQHKNFRVY